MLEQGREQLSVDNFCVFFKTVFDLKVQLDPNGRLLKYYNVGNDNHYLHATTTATSSDGHGWANVYGHYYQAHTKPCTDLHKQFKEARNRYFAVMNSGHILEL